MYLFSLFAVGLLFEIIVPAPESCPIAPECLLELTLAFFPSFGEGKGDEVKFPFVGGEMGGLCHQGFG